ncbi:MAG: phage holin family protein [Bradymonadia bacterium]
MVIKMLIRWGILTGAFVLMAAVIPQIKVRNWGAAAAGAGLFGLANIVVGFLLGLAFKILGIATLGVAWLAYPLVALVVNMIMLKFVDDRLGDKLKFEGIKALALMALAMGLTTGVLFKFV